MWTSLEETIWAAWDLVTLGLVIGVGVVVSGGVYLLGHRVIRRWQERRAEERRWGNSVPLLIAGPFPEPVAGAVANRSSGGLGILMDRPLEPDTIMTVRTVEAPAHVPWVRVRVRHRHPSGKQWLVGCQFDETVPWTVLVWFG
jgi:hypothetical protein